MWPFARGISCIICLYAYFHLREIFQFVSCEAVMVVTVMINTFWIVTSCSPVDCYKRFEGICSQSQSQSQSYVTTDGQSASLSWCQAPIWRIKAIFFFCLTISGLWVEGELSEPMSGRRAERASGWKES
jgi:hypothetical protein